MIIWLVKNLRRRNEINTCGGWKFFSEERDIFSKNQCVTLVTRVAYQYVSSLGHLFFSIVHYQPFKQCFTAIHNATVVSQTALSGYPTVVVKKKEKKMVKDGAQKTIPRFIFLLTYQRVIYAIGGDLRAVT